MHEPSKHKERLMKDAGIGDGPLKVINGGDFAGLIDMAEAIAIVSQAMVSLSAGQVVAPQRWAFGVADQGLVALMPGAYARPAASA